MGETLKFKNSMANTKG